MDVTTVILDTSTVVASGTAGAPGPAGVGVPVGGTAGQVLAKTSGVDYATEWAAPSGGGAPVDAAYLVTASDGTLSAEVVVGATPGGELGGTWAAPTVDATHSGSSHAAVQAAAEATAAALVDDLSGVTDAPTARTNLGLGTMAVQDASAVAITGGTAVGLTSVIAGGSARLGPSNTIVDINGGGSIGLHVTGATLGLDFMATEFDGLASKLDLRQTRAPSLAALAIGNASYVTQSGDVIGGWHIGGSHQAALVDCAQIFAVATETFSTGTTASGTKWQFWVTKNLTETKFSAVEVDHDGSLLLTTNRTYTSTPSALLGMRSTVTLTANYASQRLPAGIQFAETRVNTTAGAAGSNGNVGFHWSVIYKNAAGSAANFAPSSIGASTSAFWDQSTVQADTQTSLVLGLHRSLVATPTIQAINSGTLAAGGGVYGLFASPTVTDCTVGTVVGALASPPTLSGTGAVTTWHGFYVPASSVAVTTKTGLRIEALTGGTTNVGIENLSSLLQTGAATFGSTVGITGALTLTAGVTVGTTLGVTGVSSFSNGSAAAPSIALTNSSTTGLYRSAADILGFATAGVARATLALAGLTLTVPLVPSRVAQTYGVDIDPSLGDVFTWTTVHATGSITVNATTAGTAGQRMTFIITNDTTTAKTTTWGTNLKPTTTTLVGSNTNRVSVIEWVSNGTSWFEVTRNANIPSTP